MFSSSSSSNSSSDGRQEMINDHKFFSRLLSKEISASNPSFRVYYGVAPGSVPFLWESQPGTPKHTAAAAPPPPLAPPPSYYFNSSPNSVKKSPRQRKLIHAVLPRLSLRKPHPAQRPPSVSSSSSSGRSSWEEEENYEARMSPTSTLCFGDRLALKKALMYIVGHGLGHGSSD
ncbi:uncharacterized protein LOC110033933 [Phalaenopsis equestris]|uniref:uncharacterized protein LOC110033933 n=1 Tax=Phalaenopsis equestris TaxID=78828 RepID=UPI0009E37395|nr:uncharacterized protein LOC110033933 [Phalaenopsis equestris]